MAGINTSAGQCDSRGANKGSLHPLLLSAAFQLSCWLCLPWMWHRSYCSLSLCSDIQSKACGLTDITQRKWGSVSHQDMGLAFLSRTPIWSWWVIESDWIDVTWWKWEERGLDCSQSGLWLTSEHSLYQFDQKALWLSYVLHSYAYVSSYTFCAV